MIDANQAESAGYTAAPQVSQTVTVSLAAQTVSFSNGSGGAAATDSVILPDTTYVASAVGSGGARSPTRLPRRGVVGLQC